MPVTEEAPTLLEELARRYIWWKTIKDATVYPDRIIAQVMDIGDYADVQCISNELGRFSAASSQAGGDRAVHTAFLGILALSFGISRTGASPGDAGKKIRLTERFRATSGNPAEENKRR